MTELAKRIAAYIQGVDPNAEQLEVPPGFDADRVLDELIPSGQRLVGRLWESGAWTVTQEHEASQQALAIIKELAGLADPTPPGRGVLFACAEGEWHSLATMALAAGFSRHGWSVRVARPATRPAQLAALIHDFGVHVVAVSCSMQANLPGARSMVAGAIDTGTPTLVGGQAFGADDSRAIQLGASAWAPDLATALIVADDVTQRPPRQVVLSHGLAAEFHLIESARPAILHNLSAVLELGDSDDLARVELATWMLNNLRAALLCNDPMIVESFRAWLDRRAHAVGTPNADAVAEAVAITLPLEAVAARKILAA